MTDVLTPEQRRFNMSRIRSKGNRSTEERMVSLLRDKGIHGWRRHYDLPGKPDFVFRSERVALFVDGCFWHACPDCYRMPTTNVAYWQAKRARNRRRDRHVTHELRGRNWHVVRVWEHSLREPDKVAARLRRILTIAGRR